MPADRTKISSLITAILLCAIIGLAFFMALWPRHDYPYPLHVDEWMHLGNTLQIIDTGHTAYPDPWNGGEAMVTNHPETGYYLWLSTLLLTTGLDWLPLSRLMPPLILAMIAFAAYAWGRQYGCGLEAAFFSTFIHTTVRFLGPAFLVPSTLGLIFFPVSLILVAKVSEEWKLIPLIIISISPLFLMHATTAFALGLLLVIYLVFYLALSRTPFRQKLPALICILLVPISAITIYLWNPALVMKRLQLILLPARTPLPPIESPLPEQGYILLALFVLGAGFMLTRGGWKNYGLVTASALLLFFVRFYRQLFHQGPEILYERGWLYVMLLIAFIAGYGLSQLRYTGLRLFEKRRWGKALTCTLLVLIVATALWQRIEGYQQEPYYHVIDAGNYHDFMWIRDNLEDYSTAILDPYMAWSFVPVTGKYVYAAHAYPWSTKDAEIIREFLARGARDTDWLIERNIDIIYSPFQIRNPDVVEVSDRVYIVRQPG